MPKIKPKKRGRPPGGKNAKPAAVKKKASKVAKATPVKRKQKVVKAASRVPKRKVSSAPVKSRKSKMDLVGSNFIIHMDDLILTEGHNWLSIEENIHELEQNPLLIFSTKEKAQKFIKSEMKKEDLIEGGFEIPDIDTAKAVPMKKYLKTEYLLDDDNLSITTNLAPSGKDTASLKQVIGIARAKLKIDFQVAVKEKADWIKRKKEILKEADDKIKLAKSNVKTFEKSVKKYG